MPEKRMFAKTILLSDAYLDMSLGARCLYVTMSMLADDDGFVNSPKSIMRQCGASIDDLNLLIAKKFIIPFDNGVVAIKHWKINNYIQSDRYVPTKYQELLSQLSLDENKAYTMADGKPCIQNVYKVYTQIREDIEKISKEKNKDIEPNPSKRPPTLEDINDYISQKHLAVDGEKFYEFFTESGWVDSKGHKVRNWKQKLLTWNKYESNKKFSSNEMQVEQQDIAKMKQRMFERNTDNEKV